MYPIATYNLFFMDKNNENRNLLHTLQKVDKKCDRILSRLDQIIERGEDDLISSIRDTAKNLYDTSADERSRLGATMRVISHGR